MAVAVWVSLKIAFETIRPFSKNSVFQARDSIQKMKIQEFFSSYRPIPSLYYEYVILRATFLLVR